MGLARRSGLLFPNGPQPRVGRRLCEVGQRIAALFQKPLRSQLENAKDIKAWIDRFCCSAIRRLWYTIHEGEPSHEREAN